MGHVLAVDGGNTKTIAVVATTAGGVRAVSRGGPSDIYGTGSAAKGTAALGQTIRDALDRAGIAPRDVDATVCSLAGADWPEDIGLLTSFVRELGLTEPLVVNDAIGGMRVGAPRWEGIAVIAGTFNAVGARNADGRVFHLGFWPDRTGAFDLGFDALKAACRDALGLGATTALRERVCDAFDVDDALELLHHVTRRDGPGVFAVTELASVLLDVADEGDAVASEIVATAGRWLGEEARVSAARVGLAVAGTPVVLSGGVFRHPTMALEDAVMRQLDGGVAVRTSVPPIVGVVQLALDRVGVDSEADVLAERIWSGC
ncbi:MAG: hypothetical protein QOD30_143 [Actinomycetota bacterium]|nr:hypothetical protein [Actinomycetota bacterium]